MRLRRKKDDQLRKITGIAILANSIQILCAIVILFYAIFSKSFSIPESAEIILIAVAAFFVIWGAVADIRDAFLMKRTELQRQMLEEAYGQLEELNLTLRRQRHDFKNHLQVVYTLTEMQAYSDAQEYVEKIYEDVQSVGNWIRTSVPAVNALLSAKSADCSEHGIHFEVDIQSPWDEIPVAGWELCRIIGNLVDNAVDALKEAATENASVCIRIGETIPAWTLCVENNGPMIPSEHKKNIFIPGFTTKGSGHGNGLSIVNELVEKYGGKLIMSSTPERTAFSCTFPKAEFRSPEPV